MPDGDGGVPDGDSGVPDGDSGKPDEENGTPPDGDIIQGNPDVFAAFDNFASNLRGKVYQLRSGEGQNVVEMIRVEASESTRRLQDQQSKGPVLLINSAYSDCLSWFTSTVDA